MSGSETPYDVANQRTEYHQVPLILRSGSYRGLAATANHFARETHMDALANTAKMDPLEIPHEENLSNARMLAVLEAAAQSFGWPRKKTQEGQGFGIACGDEKGSYVATCAEIAVDKTSRAGCASCAWSKRSNAGPSSTGWSAQPVVGAMIQGLGGALFEAVEFENGHIKNPHFASYRVPRFRDVPEIETILLDRKDIPPPERARRPSWPWRRQSANAIFDADRRSPQ